METINRENVLDITEAITVARTDLDKLKESYSYFLKGENDDCRFNKIVGVDTLQVLYEGELHLELNEVISDIFNKTINKIKSDIDDLIEELRKELV